MCQRKFGKMLRDLQIRLPQKYILHSQIYARVPGRCSKTQVETHRQAECLFFNFWGTENVNGKAVRHLHVQLLSGPTRTRYQVGEYHQFRNATQTMYAEAKHAKLRLEVPGMSKLLASSLK